MLDLIIKNGNLVTKDITKKCDIGIIDGKITQIGENLREDAKEVIDASGEYVIPGVIDPHVHIHHPFKGKYSADDFYTATRAAAFGGTTTFLDFAIQWDKELSLKESLEKRISQSEGEAIIDFGFHVCPTKSEPEIIGELGHIIDMGAPSFKMYMTYSKQGRMSDDGMLLYGLDAVGKKGGILGVHAENDSISLFREKLSIESGNLEATDFPIAKDNIVEAEAVNRVSYINKYVNGNLYIFHLSTKEGLDILAREKGTGNRITAETCIHYLCLDDSYYGKENGHRYICSPPLRSKEDQDALWDGINKGLITTISTDHCGFPTELKDSGNGKYNATPNGLPSIGMLLPLVYTHGVCRGRISINKMVELISTNAAKTFGMYSQKGDIQVGYDADIVIFNPDREIEMKADMMPTDVDWSPYEGMVLKAFPTYTISRGQVIMEKGNVIGDRGRGKYLKRKII